MTPHPRIERIQCRPVAEPLGKGGNDKSTYLNPAAFKECRYLGPVLARLWFSIDWNSIIPNQRISQHKYLALIRWICHCFGITDHPRVEDNLTGHRAACAEWIAGQATPVLECQP